MKNLPTLRNDSSFAIQFSISVSKTTAILLFKIKIKLIEMFELSERMPGMRSAEYQATIPLKFLIIKHNKKTPEGVYAGCVGVRKNYQYVEWQWKVE